jgi:hypothetical protein
MFINDLYHRATSNGQLQTEDDWTVVLTRVKRRASLVDHTFVYTGAVRKIRELVENGGLGEIYYYDSVRVNLGLFQHDVCVLWSRGARSFDHGLRSSLPPVCGLYDRP